MKILPGIRPRGWWESFWGSESADYGTPSKTLLKYSAEFFNELKNNVAEPTAVDIGSGNGRYAIPLAKLGYMMDAIELTSAGVDRIKKEASLENVEVNASQGDFTKLYQTPKSYDVVISSGLIEEVDPMHHKNLVLGFQNWTVRGGYALVKYCLEIRGRGQLVQNGLVPELFQNKAWKIIYLEEENELHASRAQFTNEGEIDSAIRTGTVIAYKLP